MVNCDNDPSSTHQAVTPREYYELERDALDKSYFYGGEIFAMAGGSSRHSLICTNIAGELRARLKRTPCSPYESNLRLKVKATGLRTYPDVSVYCGSLELDPEDPEGQTYTNPTVLFEVLSKTTEAYDRGFKASNYRQIESLHAHVLVSQNAPQVEAFLRQADGNWLLTEARGLDSIVKLEVLGIDLPLAEIYDRVDFTTHESGS
jgi:Uma2 family endonuclease